MSEASTLSEPPPSAPIPLIDEVSLVPKQPGGKKCADPKLHIPGPAPLGLPLSLKNPMCGSSMYGVSCGCEGRHTRHVVRFDTRTHLLLEIFCSSTDGSRKMEMHNVGALNSILYPRTPVWTCEDQLISFISAPLIDLLR